jgi:hypothetical protein
MEGGREEGLGLYVLFHQVRRSVALLDRGGVAKIASVVFR